MKKIIALVLAALMLCACLTACDVFGLVKDDKHKTRALTDEKNEFNIKIGSDLFRFLYELQEEVHRFAITTFRKKYETKAVFSELESIKGVGPENRKKLLNFFLSIEKIKNADYNELCTVVDKRTAENIYNFFNKGEDDEK